MPAPVTSSSPVPLLSKPAMQKPRSQAQTRKTRIVRRRGRAKNDIESDDEIEREVATDSESGEEHSSLDSETDDSDTEPASEDVGTNGDARIRTPGRSQSPEPLDKETLDHLNSGVAPFFAPAGNWSEMVTDENLNGPADLPVIEFSQFDDKAIPPTAPAPRNSKKAAKKSRPAPAPARSPSPPASTHVQDHKQETEPDNIPSQSPSAPSYPKHVPSQNARQMYQQRLENDPSFVPKVGGFWGHDDRLMDKELRSLSPWWRGRWQGRSRGQAFSMRGRGRGGLQGSQAATNQGAEHVPPPAVELPPIERAWTHDGFEEMRKKEDLRRDAQQSQQPQSSGTFRGAPGLRGGRGGFVANRGGRGGFARGGFVGSPRQRFNTPLMPPGRVWFTMKPELMWTKQHDGFLYFEPNLKPRPGYGGGIRVKLPGGLGQVVRPPSKAQSTPKASTSQVATASVMGSDVGERSIVVCLPKRAGKEKAVETAVIEEAPAQDVFTVRPHLVAVDPIPLPEPSTTTAPTPHSELGTSTLSALPEPSVISQLEQLSIQPTASDPERWAKTEQAVLRRPSLDSQADTQQQPDPSLNEQRPSLALLQTVFTPPPVSQSSPGYGSPFAYAPPLPPGVGFNQHGMPYELATGHPVYLQPPTPMYNPRPFIAAHAPPFVPGHMRHPSAVSPDFLSHTPSQTPPVNGFIDPSTGTPIFSFPRQTSRIEIRAPTEDSAKPASKPSARTSSGLRTTASAFEPSRPVEVSDQGYYPTADTNALPSYETMEGGSGGDDGQTMQQHSHMMPYSLYQQQAYYYPEAYGYPPYMDMSQVGQYDMYSMEHQPPQGTVYY
ncbi:hypothetical protein BDQ12DRAFT_702778 [Crucibulum laeve]|uniref:Btz domain-containing protein n=1 Tax=Crucibulum laeve TaxID=68775 RepID=A0A5C3MFU7_9AGAR|nr:hypothetical protein BDQ12DRAFT_702778 [Crucibulum laeve]